MSNTRSLLKRASSRASSRTLSRPNEGLSQVVVEDGGIDDSSMKTSKRSNAQVRDRFGFFSSKRQLLRGKSTNSMNADSIKQFQQSLLSGMEREKSVSVTDSQENEDDEDSEVVDVEDPGDESVNGLGGWFTMQLVMFVIGLLLIGAGTTVEVVKENVSLGRVLCILGSYACLLLIVRGIVYSFLWLWVGLMRFTQNPDAKRVLSTVYFYMSAMQEYLFRVLWLICAIISFVALAPRNSDGTLFSNWQGHYQNYVNALVIILLVVLAGLVTLLARMYLSQGFNTRAYSNRVAESMNREFVLHVLQGIEPSSLFSFLHGQIIDTPTEGKSLDPRAWHRIARYIDTHEVDGFELPGGHKHVPLPPGEESAYASYVAPQLASKIFNRIHAFCEARRAIERTRELQSPVFKGLRRTLSADRLTKLPSGGDLTTTPILAGQRNVVGPGVSLGASPFSVSMSGGALFTTANPREGEKNPLNFSRNSNDSNDGSGGTLNIDRTNTGQYVPTTEIVKLDHQERSPTTTKEHRKASGNSISWARSPDGRLIKLRKLKRRDKRRIHKSELSQVLHEMYANAEIDVDTLWKEYLDPASTGYMTPKNVQKMVIGFFNDRSSLSITLQDAGKVFKGLDTFIMGLNLVLVFMIALSIFHINVLEVWVGLSGALVAWSFIFGNSVKTAFENVIYLFVIHPFDCGDHLDVGEPPVRMEVLRIHLYATELLRWDGTITVMENRLLANVPVFNYKMSKNRGRAYVWDVDLEAISTERLVKMRREYKAFLSTMPDKFSGNYVVHARSCGNPLKCQLLIYCEFAYPHTNLDRSFDDESVLLEFICGLLVRNKMRYTGSGLGVVGSHSTQLDEEAVVDAVLSSSSASNTDSFKVLATALESMPHSAKESTVAAVNAAAGNGLYRRQSSAHSFQT